MSGNAPAAHQKGFAQTMGGFALALSGYQFHIFKCVFNMRRNHRYLRHQMGHLNQTMGGLCSRQDQFHMFRLFMNQISKFIHTRCIGQWMRQNPFQNNQIKMARQNGHSGFLKGFVSSLVVRDHRKIRQKLPAESERTTIRLMAVKVCDERPKPITRCPQHQSQRRMAGTFGTIHINLQQTRYLTC